MAAPILATKLYVPPARPRVISRLRLLERLNEGLTAGRKLTLISAPAGFGKTTLLSEWAAGCGRPAAWLSLDAGDGDPIRFLTYLVAALQRVAAGIGDGLLGVLHAPQPPPPESTLTTLLNDVTSVPSEFVVVLDDYHVLDAKPVDDAVAFLVEHLPPQAHLVIATREDPALPLARWRARGQLTELRAADLRFTPTEAAAFLNQVMDLSLTAEEVAALEARTEGWIAGLQLAAISLHGQDDVTGFINSFTGSHRFVLDYLVEEVLEQQSRTVQSFLLRTSVLERLCGPLCDAVLGDPSVSASEILAALDRANLFIVPLDDERRWYRYHHLFAELLRQRLSTSQDPESIAALHIRASAWYEDNGLEIDAFQHAAAANDVERAERLIEGKGLPLQFRGALAPILRWLASLPATVLDARPSLWATYASVLLSTGQTSGIEEKLQAAEKALQAADADNDDNARDVVGRIAATRAMLAISQHRLKDIITQSRRALEYLHPGNLAFRTSTVWRLGYAHQFQGNRAEARKAYAEAVATSRGSGNTITEILASIGLGNMQEADNQLHAAAETYASVVGLAADLPFPVVSEAHLGLARVRYQWNDLETAERHWQQSLQLARQLEHTDRAVVCEVFHARLQLARGDVAGAEATLAEAERSARQHKFMRQIPEIAAAKVMVLLRQGGLAAAAEMAQAHELPLSQARVRLAHGDAGTALTLLEPYRRRAEQREWADEQLKAMILQALAHDAASEAEDAVPLLGDALALAEPGGFIRVFVDEGPPMARLLRESLARRVFPEHVRRLLAAFPLEEPELGRPVPPKTGATGSHLAEPLSKRELEVLTLIAQGLTNQDIATRLYLSLHTVKVHARSINGKLGVSTRTQAVARGRAFGLLARD
jgi:LuxR family transcriptional regulator, maltose regulon positive regulatory protein